MSAKLAIRALLIFLLGIHSVWIVIHLNLVARDQINPWKLSGYGMYTRPAPDLNFEVFWPSELDPLIDIAPLRWFGLYEADRRFSFHCTPLGARQVNAFLITNPQFIDRKSVV